MEILTRSEGEEPRGKGILKSILSEIPREGNGGGGQGEAFNNSINISGQRKGLHLKWYQVRFLGPLLQHRFY